MTFTAMIIHHLMDSSETPKLLVHLDDSHPGAPIPLEAWQNKQIQTAPKWNCKAKHEV